METVMIVLVLIAMVCFIGLLVIGCVAAYFKAMSLIYVYQIQRISKKIGEKLKQWKDETPIGETNQSQDKIQQENKLSFGGAIKALKEGKKVVREGWNGKGMFLAYVKQDTAYAHNIEVRSLTHLPWIGMKTADNKFVPWLASQTDMLAEDWMVV